MPTKPYILGVIPARGNSKSLKDKNIRDLAGKPLIAHTISSAKKSKLLSQVVVSTDSKKIAEIAKQHGGDVPFLRPSNLAKDTTPTYPVLQHAVKFVEKKIKRKVDVVVLLDVTAPLRTTADIDKCISKLIKDNADTVCTITESERNPYFNMMELQGDVLKVVKQPTKPVLRRQDAPKVFNITSSVYAMTRATLMDGNSVWGPKTMGVKVPQSRAGHIDHEEELEAMDRAMRKKNGIPQPTNALEMFNLQGKVAIVTGATGILGSEHCRTLASAGATVVVTDLKQTACDELVQELQSQYGTVAIGIKTDLSKESDIINMVKSVVKKCKRIDILVNNAAAKTENFFAPFEKFPKKDWDKIMSVNMTSMNICSQQVIPHMIKNGGGSIINIASIYGVVGPQKKMYKGSKIGVPAVYAASKGGVVNFTKYLACMFGDKGIRVNTITPGGVKFENVPIHGKSSKKVKQNTGFVKEYSSRVPLGRMASQKDFAGALVFLASDASSYVTGANIIVDGGWTAW